jgi:RPA family protein
MLREVGSGRRQQVTGGVARGQERVENEMWRMQVIKKTKGFYTYVGTCGAIFTCHDKF